MHEQLTLFDLYKPATSVDRSTAGKYGNYALFQEKFKSKKTTDDCYTPPAVMDVVNNYVRGLAGVNDRPFVRPFVPGGDFENYDYPEGCIVVDNPPFSIYAKIVRWYLKHGIDFFLFAPTLTQIVLGADVTYLTSKLQIVYENGARVNTSFTTSLIPEYRFIVTNDLSNEIKRVQHDRERKTLAKYDLHPNITTTALLQKYDDKRLLIKKSQCDIFGNSDEMKRRGKSTFGGCVIVSDEIAAQLDRESHNGEVIGLSMREKEIVRRLNNENK